MRGAGLCNHFPLPLLHQRFLITSCTTCFTSNKPKRTTKLARTGRSDARGSTGPVCGVRVRDDAFVFDLMLSNLS
eukprot:m.229682 g.229682  ORF g.229682 m.229682 type:complete len:75 (+) comp17056_c0_seq1:4320-4544(+)